MKKHNDELDAAQEIGAIIREGEAITHQAALLASANMARMLANLNTSAGKTEALRHHGLYVGIGTMFMQEVSDKASSMTDEIIEIHRKDGIDLPRSDAKILTGMWLAKIFMEIEKGIRQHNEQV